MKNMFFNTFETKGLAIALSSTIDRLQKQMELDPSEFIDSFTDNDEPSIDIRLGIGKDKGGFYWVINTGLSDYDQVHHPITACSCVSLDTTAKELLKELLLDAENSYHENGLANEGNYND